MNREPARLAESNPVVIGVAPNGARRTKADHWNLPLSKEEIATQAAACAAAGARMLHLHVRDRDGRHTLDTSTYRETLATIRNLVEDRLILQVTTESVSIYSPAEQMTMVRELQPEAISMALREVMPDPSYETEVANFLGWTSSSGIAVQYIVYSATEARHLVSLSQRGLVPEARPNVLFVLGRHTTDQQSTPGDLLPFVQAWPEGWSWSACAFGRSETACMGEAIALGGHVRVGFENSLQMPDGSLAHSNTDNVSRVRDLALGSGRGIATIPQARQLYGLPQGAQQGGGSHE